MEYTGLYRKYKLNRPLTDVEIEHHLHQEVRLQVEPVYQLSVIRLNSTYLELVDKFYAWKGFATLAIGSLGLINIWFGISMTYTFMDAALFGSKVFKESAFALFLNGMASLILLLATVWVVIWLIRKESFAYTHYPIRLNRRKRKVYVFKPDGSTLTANWQDIFFCLAPTTQGWWDIQGHILASDGKTVLDTFSLSYSSVKSGKHIMLQFWEFVRRYMEEGPEDAAKRVQFFVPVIDRKEPWLWGFQRMVSEGAINIVLLLMAVVLAAAIMPGRLFAIHTSKLPRWPQAVEDECAIEPDDPYVRP